MDEIDSDNQIFFLFSVNVTVESSPFKVSADDAVIKSVPAVRFRSPCLLHVTVI